LVLLNLDAKLYTIYDRIVRDGKVRKEGHGALYSLGAKTVWCEAAVP